MSFKLVPACLLAVCFGAQADVVSVNTSTYFKKTTADSTTLAASDKCWVTAGNMLGAGPASTVASNHYAATLDSALPGCGFTSGYFYAPHVSWQPDPVTPAAQDPSQVWYTGTLAANSKVDDNNLAPLTIAASGNKFWKSNNPEIFTGTGWLMENSRTDTTRGGQAYQLTGGTSDAINKSQGNPAIGQIYSTSPTTFGREGGVYAASVMSGSTDVVLPASNGQYIGFAFNTTAKNNANLQEQTSAYVSRLSDSADRAYGNYGHRYDANLRLFNTNSAARNVRISFASSYTAATNSPSFTFSSPASFNGAPIDLWTTPTQPRQVIGTYVVPANSYFDARLIVYIAGLGVTNQQLIVETVN